MYVIVVGCGRVGSELAHRLFRQGHEVTIIDEVGASFRNLHPDYRGRTIEGSVLSEEVLRRAETFRADGLAAVTNSDTVNAVVGHAARELFGMRNVVVRNFNPRLLPLHLSFRHRVVSSTVWGAERIETLLYHPEQQTLLTLGARDIEVFELRLTAPWSGRTVSELLAGIEAVPVTLTRAGISQLARPETELEDGDLLQVAATAGVLEGLQARLSPPSSGERE
ncbi:MAG: potassium channel family protein [Vicinamibacteria bacterium]